MKDDTKSINALHSEYCRLARAQIALTTDRAYWWGAWVKRGFVIDDLQLVITAIRNGIKSKRRYPEALKWSNLIQDLDKFEEDLALVKAEGVDVYDSQRQMTVTELHRIKEAKQAMLDEMKMLHANEDAFGLAWDSAESKAAAIALRREIRKLTISISQMA